MMLNHLLKLPFMVILLGWAALSMLPVAAYAKLAGEDYESRVFFYAGILFFILAGLLAIATGANRGRSVLRSHLLALAGVYLLLPAVLAVPFYEAVRNTSFLNSYFEMLSSLTTTGATLFDDPARLSNSVHLWRATVGWLGGMFTWIVAIAILAPLNLGGYEVTARVGAGRTGQYFVQITEGATPARRLAYHAGQLIPIYAGLTGALWIFLFLAGEDPFIALCHAMSTLSTSGISPVGGLSGGSGGLIGEGLVFIFLFFAISRLTFAPETQSDSLLRLRRDPEFRMGMLCVMIFPLLLFLRHWSGAFEFDDPENLSAALTALWGAGFMVLSFLTTTGFESSVWQEARNWSGLETPGLVLMGFAMIGGGVATTAGGVKLLRVYALYKHGARELQKLVHPNSIAGQGAEARHLRRQGAYISWIFFMLFAISLAVVMLLLSLQGIAFEDAAVLSVAALSTTGPLTEIAAESPARISELGAMAKVILGAAMILGRLETLAIIALLNPDFWRS